MREIERSDLQWSLYETESGALVLSVLCGTVAIYTIDIVLVAHERESYESEGRLYIDRLAGHVVSDPEGFGERHLVGPWP